MNKFINIQMHGFIHNDLWISGWALLWAEGRAFLSYLELFGTAIGTRIQTHTHKDKHTHTHTHNKRTIH